MKLLFIFLSILLLASCGHVRTDGGQSSFDPELFAKLKPSEHATYAQTIVKREERDPDGIKLKELIHSKYGSIRKIGLVLFETQIQPSITGLAVGENIYLSDKGKQILSREFFNTWNSMLNTMSSVTWVKPKTIMKSKAFRGYGSVVIDHILREKAELNDTDIFWKSGGKEIPMGALVLPPNSQDVSILYIPAIEMMGGAKMVEHQKHWVNDICKELGLDAVLIVSSTASWEQGSVDKRTKEIIPEEMKIGIESSILYPFSAYHNAAKDLTGSTSLPKKSVPLAFYSVKTKIPVKISVPESERTFKTIQDNILTPLRTNYLALSKLVIDRIITDIHQTYEKVK